MEPEKQEKAENVEEQKEEAPAQVEEQKVNEPIEVENTGFFYCAECKKIPRITINKETMEIGVFCGCAKEKKLEINQFLESVQQNKGDKSMKICAQCENEGCQGTMTVFCQDCLLNMCPECKKKHPTTHQMFDIEETYPEENLKKRIESIEEWENEMHNYYRRFKESLDDLQAILDQRKEALAQVVKESESAAEYFKSLILTYKATKEVPNYNVRSNLLENDFGAVLSFRQKILKNQAKSDIDGSKYVEFLKQANIKKSKANEGDFLKDSSLLKSPEEVTMVMEWLNGKGTVTAGKLLYKGTVDGDTYDNFIDKCENAGPTVSIFQADNGRRFGGFTKASWTRQKDEAVSRKDPDAFLFSLDNKRAFAVKDEKHAAKSSFQFCQMFGNTYNVDGLIICLNYLTKEGSYENHKKDHGPVYDMPSPNELVGKEKFKIVENEVYQIEFE